MQGGMTASRRLSWSEPIYNEWFGSFGWVRKRNHDINAGSYLRNLSATERETHGVIPNTSESEPADHTIDHGGVGQAVREPVRECFVNREKKYKADDGEQADDMSSRPNLKVLTHIRDMNFRSGGGE
jgi:hypothetical protein